MGRLVRVRLFAVARAVAGAEAVEIALEDNATVADLRTALLVHLPALAPMGSLLRFAINNDYAADNAPIPDLAEIACIPPVSGG